MGCGQPTLVFGMRAVRALRCSKIGRPSLHSIFRAMRQKVFCRGRMARYRNDLGSHADSRLLRPSRWYSSMGTGDSGALHDAQFEVGSQATGSVAASGPLLITRRCGFWRSHAYCLRCQPANPSSVLPSRSGVCKLTTSGALEFGKHEWMYMSPAAPTRSSEGRRNRVQ
jgi:hypothetical protein